MEEEQDIQSDIVKQKQLRDAQENQEFDRDMDAYRRGKELTDEQRKQVLQDNARKRQQVEQEKQLLGSRVLDAIEYGAVGSVKWLQKQAEEDPDRYTDDMLRLLGGGVKNVGWALSKVPFLDKIAQGEDWLAEQARAMSTQLTPQLDPRFAGWGTRVATGLIADKGFGKAYKVSKPLLAKALKNSINNIPAGLVYASNRADDIQRFMTNKYKREVRGLMNKYGMGDGVFRMDIYDKAKGAYTENVNRFFLERFFSPDNLKGSFTGFKNAQKGSFQRIWGEFLEAKGLDPTLNIQAHHINSLYDGLHLYDGVKWNSPEYWELTATLLNRNARPGVIQKGDDISNLIMTMGKAVDPNTPHGIAHKFYNNFTPDFFNADEMRKIREIPGYRIKKAERWATLVNKSEEVLLEAHRVWISLNPKIDLEFDEIIERMTKYNELGYNKLIDPKYQVPDIPKIVKEVIDDYKAGNVPSALGGKSQSPSIQVQPVKQLTQRQQELKELNELRKLVKDNKKNYNKQELARMKQTIKSMSDRLEGKQKSIFDRTGL